MYQPKKAIKFQCKIFTESKNFTREVVLKKKIDDANKTFQYKLVSVS